MFFNWPKHCVVVVKLQSIVHNTETISKVQQNKLVTHKSSIAIMSFKLTEETVATYRT